MDWMQVFNAFWVGGLICVAGQLLIDLTAMTPARILVLFVTLGVALTGVGAYQPLVRFAGSGATVPLTGFGYTLAVGVQQAVQRDGLFGALTSIFTIKPLSIKNVITCSMNPSVRFNPMASSIKSSSHLM